jgi:hypothetical protein
MLSVASSLLLPVPTQQQRPTTTTTTMMMAPPLPSESRRSSSKKARSRRRVPQNPIWMLRMMWISGCDESKYEWGIHYRLLTICLPLFLSAPFFVFFFTCMSVAFCSFCVFGRFMQMGYHIGMHHLF